MSLNIIPENLSNLSKSETRIANKIISLYSKIERECYLYVQPRLRNLEPDFILIDANKGACIIEVKDWSKNYIKSINRVKITTNDDKNIENPIFKGNRYFNFAKGLFENDNRLLDEEGNLVFKIYSWIIFTSINSSEFESFNLDTVFNQPPTKYLSNEQIGDLTIEKLFSFEISYLDPNRIRIIRSILFPEIKIQDKQGIEKDIIKTLDANQEKFAKRIPYGHYMISGVPGSGKTVILISRAIFLLKENPHWKIKIVTYNKSLSMKINQNLENYYDEFKFFGLNYENLSVSTLHSLAKDVANIIIPNNPTEDFWEELPSKALEKATPRYDAILIDEYQDFYDDWIKLCLALCKKHEYEGILTENLFLAGDRLQSIYNPKEHTWKSLGINIIGRRSKLLKHSYRAGKSHIELALDFLIADKKLKKEVEKFYEGRDGINNENVLNNQIEFLEGNYSIINDYLKKCIFEFGYKKEEILILAPTHHDEDELFNYLDDVLKSISKVSKQIDDTKMNITTYHSSKGLECKICILVNVDKIDNKKLLYVGMTRASEKLCIHSRNYEKKSLARQLKNREFNEENISEIINHTLSDYLFP